MTIFDERYRVIATEDQCLIIRGLLSGKVLIINADPACPLNEEYFGVGKLIALSDPSAPTN
jgi:hypothetical protein